MAGSVRTQIALGVVAALLAASGGLVVWIRQAPSAVTLETAVADFRGRDDAAAPSDAGAAPADGAAAVADGAPATAAAAAGKSTAVPAGSAAVPAAVSSPAPGSAPRASSWPAEGVYAFSTEGGGETDAVGGARHDYPAQTPVTVRRAGCGYTIRWQPLNERWDEWEFCPDGALRPMARISTYHEFFHRGISQDFDCGRAEMLPADRTPGSTRRWGCRSADGSAVDATTTIVGVETLQIGGVAVQALHQRNDVVFSGGNRGSQVFDWWLAVDTGMLVHMTRELQVKSDSPFGEVAYRERFTSTARSMTPKR